MKLKPLTEQQLQALTEAIFAELIFHKNGDAQQLYYNAEERDFNYLGFPDDAPEITEEQAKQLIRTHIGISYRKHKGKVFIYTCKDNYCTSFESFTQKEQAELGAEDDPYKLQEIPGCEGILYIGFD